MTLSCRIYYPGELINAVSAKGIYVLLSFILAGTVDLMLNGPPYIYEHKQPFIASEVAT
jgi:hypothetical protein